MNYTAFAFIPYVDITNIINIMKPTIENEVVQVCTRNCAAHFSKPFLREKHSTCRYQEQFTATYQFLCHAV